MFKKLLSLKNAFIVSVSMIVAMIVVFVFMFSTNIGAVAYQEYFKGNILIDGVIHSNSDVTLYAHQTGNAGAKNQVQGLPKIQFVTFAQMTNGTIETARYLDDSPTGEWTEVDAGTSVLLTADTDYYKVGANSLKIALTADAVSGDGALGTMGANDNLEANESVGFWIYSTKDLAAGDFKIWLVDGTSAPDVSFNVPLVKSGLWKWVEVDIATITPGDADVVTDIQFLMSATGATNLAAVDIYLDAMYKWDADDEETLGNTIITDGVLGVTTLIDAAANLHRTIVLTEYTDYFIHTQTGNDAIVTITNQVGYAGLALIAYE